MCTEILILSMKQITEQIIKGTAVKFLVPKITILSGYVIPTLYTCPTSRKSIRSHSTCKNKILFPTISIVNIQSVSYALLF